LGWGPMNFPEGRAGAAGEGEAKVDEV
jgi:hypothetical protein